LKNKLTFQVKQMYGSRLLGGEPNMKPIIFVFICLLVIAGIIGFVLVSEPPAGATGVPHETIQAMSVGGDGAARLAEIGRAPFYFQIAVIFLSVGLLYMGVAKHRRDRRLRLLFAVGTAFALLVWVMLYTGYEAFLVTGKADIVFGFPVTTNWMLWGIWGSFVFFNLIFVIFFRDYFLPYEDEAAFDALVREMKASDAAGDV
jgi:hypothetical protein